MPNAQRETESRYDVDDATPLPELEDLPGVHRLVGPQSDRVEASYFDTAERALGRRGVTLRRRTGGEGEGWHLELTVNGTRHEFGAPLGRSTTTPPIALRRIVQGVVRDGTLARVATLTTERAVISLVDAEDSLLAVIRDRRVVATRGDEEQFWREWELEQHAARGKLRKAVVSRLRDAGGRPATDASPLDRVMEPDTEDPAEEMSTPGKRATEHELLGHHLKALRADVHQLDPLARADAPEAVHQLRVVCRRMRDTLTTFHKYLDTSATDPIRDDLEWIRDLLGRPRDLEVLRLTLDQLLLEQPAELLRGRPGQWIDGRLRVAHRAAHRETLAAMSSERYFQLLSALDEWDEIPPWRDQRDRPASRRLVRALDGEWTRLERAVAAVAEGPEHQVLLHEVRKAARRTRYAAETLAPVLGSDARKTARAAKGIQRVLGEHHDAVVAGERLLELSDEAAKAGRDTFTFGVLRARLDAMVADHERAFERAWSKARKARPRKR